MRTAALIVAFLFSFTVSHGQEEPIRLKLEFGGLFFFGLGVGRSNNQIDNRNVAHLFENSRPYGLVHAPITVALRDSITQFFVQWQLLKLTYGVNPNMNIQLLQDITPLYQVSRQSKYSTDVIDDSPTYISSRVHNVYVGKHWTLSKRWAVLSSLGLSYTSVKPTDFSYAFKENDSNVFYIHSYESKRLRGIGYTAAMNLRFYLNREIYLGLISSYHYFQKKGTVTEQVVDMNKVELPSIDHHFQFKTTTFNTFISLGVVM
ncbi:MAG: hypothetical protein ACOYLH_09835 [Flavobacteriales bacterium]